MPKIKFTNLESVVEFTNQLATKLRRSEGAKILAFTGDLGTGKTTFSQSLLCSLGVNEPVVSPTFVLIREYNLQNQDFQKAYHLDLYRLGDPREIFALGLTVAMNNPNAIILIEWGERIKSDLPNSTLWFTFTHGENEQERILEYPEII